MCIKGRPCSSQKDRRLFLTIGGSSFALVAPNSKAVLKTRKGWAQKFRRLKSHGDSAGCLAGTKNNRTPIRYLESGDVAKKKGAV